MAQEIFENIEKNRLGGETQSMLVRLEARIKRKELDKSATKEAVESMAQAVIAAKKEIDKADFAKLSIVEIKNMSNPWTALKSGIFKKPEIEGPLKRFAPEKGNWRIPAYKFARQIWRTDIVEFLADKLKRSARTDKAQAMEQIMAAQIVGEKQNDPIEALTSAVLLDKRLGPKETRKTLADEMEKSELGSDRPIGFNPLKLHFTRFEFKKIKVMTGGALMEVPFELAQKFEFKKIVFRDGRIYAQMANGCKGNLVIIEVKAREAEVAFVPAPLIGRELTSEQAEHLVDQLKANFTSNSAELPKLHPNVKWTDVEKALRAQPTMMWSLSQMEETGGRVDVIEEDNRSFLFGDTSQESPPGRRNVVFDKAAEAGLRKGTFAGNAVDMAKRYGAELMSKEQYQALQTKGNFDKQTWSWLKTPSNVREAGGALGGLRVGVCVGVVQDRASIRSGYGGFRCALRVPKVKV